MTTNKPNVQRYADMGCPEQICRVDTMHESDDGDYVLYEDYEALQAENEQLVGALRHLRNHTSVNSHQIELIDAAAQEASHDHQ
jgi:hypothetical protein